MSGRSSRSSRLDRLISGIFEPRSLAVVGASSHPDKVGYSVLANIIKSGYEGDIYPVNPKAKKIQELKCYPGVNALPEGVDLAIIIVPAPAVPGVIAQCVDRRFSAGVIISAGFREIGVEGRKLEVESVKLARKGRMQLVGPNCLGVMNTSLPLNASFSRRVPPKGSIGVISQSGAICTSLIDWARAEQVGFSKLVSLGNSADLAESDFLDALAVDEDTSVISMYIEGVADGERFFKSLTRANRRKPVIFLKAGATHAGAKAASSHTGALAGSDSAYTAACKQAPALRAESIEELILLSRAFATEPVPAGPRVGIVTNAGGPGIIASDACERYDLVLAQISGRTLDSLRMNLPPAASLHNPIDVLGDADSIRYAVAVEALLADDAVDSVLVILTPQAMTEILRTAEEVIKIARRYEKTLLCSFMGAASVHDAVRRLQRAGIPNIPYPDEAMKVISRMYERAEHRSRKAARPARFEVDRDAVKALVARYHEKGERQVTAEDCRAVLTAYGIPNTAFRFAADKEAAMAAAAEVGFPVALKIDSPQVIHKTDVGGVKLGIKNRRALDDAYDEMMYEVRRKMPMAEIHGVSVQEMAPPGRELILGLAEDPQFGPLLMVGLGGIYVEAFKDVVFRLAPVTAEEASRMLRELKAFHLLAGLRGEEPADVGAVEEVLLRISQLSTDNREISEMDINPLMVYNSGHGCTCVDVRMTLGG